MSSRFQAAMLVAASVVLCCRGDDLLTVYRQAAETSPVLARARSLLEAEQAGRLQAKGALGPRLELDGSVSRNRIDLKGFSPEPIDEDYTASSYSASLTQPVIAGSDWATLRAAGAQVRSAAAAVLAAEQKLIMEVCATYFAVLRARADERAAKDEVELLQTVRDQARRAHEVGSGDVIAVQEAQAQLDAARSVLLRAENGVRLAKRSLERLTHRPTGPLADLRDLEPEGPSPDDMNAWVASALTNQPLLQQARADLDASEAQIAAASRRRWPVVALSAEYSDADGAFAPDIDRKESLVGVSAAWPLFEGGQIRAARARAEAAAAAVRHSRDALTDEVKLNAERAFLSLEDSVAQYRAARRALESSSTALDGTRKGYEVGSRSIVDLLDGVRRHTSAQAERDAALYNQVLARLRLKAAAGVLSEPDVRAINELLTEAVSE